MGTENAITEISQQYYIMAQHWASDLAFFKVETLFLRGLMENHFMALCDKKYIEELKKSGKLLMDLAKDEYDCDQLISLQLTKLSLLAKYSLLDNKDELKQSQLIIENIVTNITKEYHQVKTDIFKLIELLLLENTLINQRTGHLNC